MIFYYDNTGKLITVSAHGEIPRQGGALNVYVYLNKNFNSVADSNPDGLFDGNGINNRMMKVLFKTPDSLVFSEDYIMENLGLQTFTKLSGENIGSLIDGEEYYVFSVDLSNTYALVKNGYLELAFTMLKYTETDDEAVNDWSSTLQFGKATIFVEETLGLTPASGIGMTFSEYTSLMGALNSLVNSVDDLEDSKVDKTKTNAGKTSNINNLGNQIKFSVVNGSDSDTLEEILTDESYELNLYDEANDNDTIKTSSSSVSSINNGSNTTTETQTANSISFSATNGAATKILNITPTAAKINGNEIITDAHEIGTKLAMSLNNTTYVLTLSLLDDNNNVLDTKTVDLPLEDSVVNGDFIPSTKILILNKRDGSSYSVDLSSLASTTYVDTQDALKLDKSITLSGNTTTYLNNGTGSEIKTVETGTILDGEYTEQTKRTATKTSILEEYRYEDEGDNFQTTEVASVEIHKNSSNAAEVKTYVSSSDESDTTEYLETITSGRKTERYESDSTYTYQEETTVHGKTITATNTDSGDETVIVITPTNVTINNDKIAVVSDITAEATARGNADNNLQSQIDAINAAQNLADIVADLTALNNYDTSGLEVNDKVEVLSDSNHDYSATVYNWTGSAWQYIGKYGDSYSKAESDAKYVNLTGTQTISGSKTFTNNTYWTIEDNSNHRGQINIGPEYLDITYYKDSSLDNYVNKTTNATNLYDKSYIVNYTNGTETRREQYSNQIVDEVEFSGGYSRQKVDNAGVYGMYNKTTSNENYSCLSGIYNYPYFTFEGTNTSAGNPYDVNGLFQLNYNGFWAYLKDNDTDNYGSLRVSKNEITLKAANDDNSTNNKTLTLSMTNGLTLNGNKIIDTANASTELFMTDAEIETMLEEVFG